MSIPVIIKNQSIKVVVKSDTVKISFLQTNTLQTINTGGGGGGTGDVVGPSASVDSEVVLFSGTTGKVIRRQATARIKGTDRGGFQFPGVAGPVWVVAGEMLFDTDNDCMTVYNSVSDISLQVGQEEWVRVRNVSGSAIPNGSPVYISGADSGFPTVALADADLDTTAQCIGLATHSIANNTTGFVCIGGAVRGVDTSAFAVGAQLYLSQTAGALTATVPTVPAFRVPVARVLTSNATTGMLLVRPGVATRASRSAIYKTNVSAALTGSIAETKMYTNVLIPAGTIQANDILNIRIGCTKVGAAGAHTIRVYFNTSDAIGGGQVLMNAGATGNLWSKTVREGYCKNSTSAQVWYNLSNAPNDVIATNVAKVSTTINFANDTYLIVTSQNGSAADTSTIESFLLEIVR